MIAVQEHDVIFTSADEDAATQWNQSQAAKKLAPEFWRTAVTDIGWQMRWTMMGLQPQRPLVVMSQDVTLEPKQVLLLC